MEFIFIDGIFIGGAIGVFIGSVVAWYPKRQHVLRMIPEEDMVREIKRRRFEWALKNKTGSDVERELNGPPPNPRKD
jgi:hypothetical protein